MRAFLLCCVAFLAGPTSAEEAPIWATALLPQAMDRTLLSERMVCAAGQFHIATRTHLQTVSERSFALPKVVPHCLAVLAETARREAALDLYWRLTVDNVLFDARQIGPLQSDEFRTVLAAAQANATTYVSMTGETRALPCPLAFDAGFHYGAARPSAQVAGLDVSERDRLTATCFEEGSALPSAYGLTAGILAGQAWARAAN
ncbi:MULTISPECIES: hypothetical protein [Jannaschia]|nr:MULTISPECIES: hypothetical protein [unclassified Jannaschia]